MPRRYFARFGKQIHYNKENDMGGQEYRILQPHETAAFARGQESISNPVQDSIDSLNAAIDRLDKIIKEMQSKE